MAQSQESKSDQSSNYKWTNRNQYQYGGVQEIGDALLKQHGSEAEEKNVAKLFHLTMEQSQGALLYINDDTKEMTLHNLGIFIPLFRLQQRKASYRAFYKDIKNKFTYSWSLGYLFGQRGAIGDFFCISDKSKFKYVLSLETRLRERLDNSFTCNSYKAGVRWYQDKLKYFDTFEMGVFRQSRENQLNFFNEAAKKSHKFGTEAPDTELSKHSNLLCLMYEIRKSYFTLLGKLGLDASNISYFTSLQIKMENNFKLGQNFKLKLDNGVGNIWGSNILKNDLFMAHSQKWPGFRSKNYIQNRAELHFINYPFLSLMSWNPYLYAELWTTFHPNTNRGFDSKFKGDYGIGLASENYSLNVAFSLFSFSKERKMGVFGPIKFQFED